MQSEGATSPAAIVAAGEIQVQRPAFGVTSKNLKGVSKSCVELWHYLA